MASLIHYYIVLKKGFFHRSDLSEELTPSSWIYKPLMHSQEMIKMIYQLPSISNELLLENDLDAHKKKYKGLNYDINFIYEHDVFDVIKLLQADTLACFFICEGVDNQVIDAVLGKTKCPIVTSNGYNQSIQMDSTDALKEIYTKFYKVLGRDFRQESLEYLQIQYKKSNLDLRTNIVSTYLDVLIATVNNYNKSDRRVDDQKLNAILKPAGISRESLDMYLKTAELDIYNEMIESLKSNYHELEYMPFEINVCIPSVEYKQIIKHWEVSGYTEDVKNHRINNKVKSAAKMLSKNETTDKLLGVHTYIDSLIDSRSLEKNFLKVIGLLFGYARRVPFVFLNDIPTAKIKEAIVEMKRADKSLGHNDIIVMNNNFGKISEVLSENIDVDKVIDIMKFSSHLKIFSDLPIEWLQINGVPLLLLSKMSRVPLIPFSGVLRHAEKQNDYTLKKDKYSIMIVNVLDKREDKFLYGTALGVDRYIKDFITSRSQREYTYLEPRDKNEYFDRINEVNPDILIHFGHGGYGESEEYGCLKLSSDSITPRDIYLRLDKAPRIVLLCSCETQVDWNVSGNIANAFIQSGVISVMGSHFEISGKYTHHLILQILFNMSQLERFSKKISWSEIVGSALRTMYLFDTFNSIEKGNDKMIGEYKSYCEKRNKDCINIEFHEMVSDFLKGTYPELEKKYSDLRKRKTIFYNSLYFTVLGSPELIAFE